MIAGELNGGKSIEKQWEIYLTEPAERVDGSRV